MLTPREFGKLTERFIPRLISTVVPIFVYHSDHRHLRQLPIGTGLLFGVAARRFVITARHVLDGFTAYDQLVLANSTNGTRFTINPREVIRPSDTNLDMMLVPLDALAVEKLAGKEFVGLESLALTDQTDPNVFTLVGYPQDLAHQTPTDLHALCLNAHLSQEGVPIALQAFVP